ncbi:hypothetical protein ACIBAC_00575 [Streptomyces sp. NPDC051362]|uniref:hypothetical protein n=1 Tax=Streptomyces sp. NPDC051362 TaxID=3365651 RepID=UPI0037B4CBB7
MTTPYERLMAEGVPTGRFGDPVSDRPGRDALMTVQEQQAARRAALVGAQSDWRLPDETSRRKRERSAEKSAERAAERARQLEQDRPRHLRIVPDQNDTHAA